MSKYSGYHRVAEWKGDRNYYSVKDPRRAEHIRAIEINDRIDNRISASSGDGSYSIVLTRGEMR
jgi:hypothetical protein